MAIQINQIALQNKNTRVVSTEVTIPINAKGTIEVIMDLDPTEYEDASRALVFGIYVFINSEWRRVVSGLWKGVRTYDAVLGVNPMPRVSSHMLSALAGKKVRVEIDDPKGKKVGMRLSIT